MSVFDLFTLFGGLALFLYGMSVMGNSLEKLAGSRLKAVLGSMTSNVFKGFLLGLGVTAIIKSSSATTVMVVGFVNSGLMTLRQATGVIMGANLGVLRNIVASQYHRNHRRRGKHDPQSLQTGNLHTDTCFCRYASVLLFEKTEAEGHRQHHP